MIPRTRSINRRAPRGRLFLFATCLAAATAASGAPRLVERVAPDPDDVVIPYAKYVLDNGLTVVIHEDRSDPLVHVDVTYHVGSAREDYGKSGFAHFFEHMMFQGSENVADEEHFKIVTESGGTLNGTTNRDRTNYFQTVPSNQLEIVLWLEADRMGFLLDAVTQEKFEIQRSTVKNEKAQRYDNTPYGGFQEKMAKALYPPTHPYSWLTIGDVEDLDRVGVEDLKDFFLRWYGPNNATLTIGGDTSEEEVLRLVEKYFGVIPPGPGVDAPSAPDFSLYADRYVSLVDRNIRFPALLFVFPSVPQFHPDEPALQCLAEILGEGKKSYFYQRFVRTRKAIQSSVFHNTAELGGEFVMFVLPFPGQSLADFEAELRDALLEFERNGVRDEEILKFKAKDEAQTINGLASVSGKVSRLAAYETFLGDPNHIRRRLADYRAVTREDVLRVYDQYIKDQPAVIISVLPEGMENGAARPDSFEIPAKIAPAPTPDADLLTYRRPQGDDFDRSQRPGSGPNPVVPVPDFWTAEMDNGLRMIGTRTREVPTVAIRMRIGGGHRLDDWMPEKAGLASLTADLLTETTKNYTPEELSEALEMLGSSISVSAGDDATYVSVSTLARNLSPTLDLLEEVLFRPAFVEDDFERLRKQQLEGLQAMRKEPSGIADLVYSELLYGPDAILGIPTLGTEDSIQRIGLDDVRSFFERYYSPSVTEVVVVGDVDRETVLSELGFLGDWKQRPVSALARECPPDYERMRIHLVDKPGAPQSEIRIGYLTDLSYDATGEFFRTVLMNYVLGGAFNSRINLNLREDKGYTYGARSGFSADKETGPFTASAGVKAEFTGASVREFLNEIRGYREGGITDEELAFMKSSIGQRDALRYETPPQKAGFLAPVLRYDLPADYTARQQAIIDEITVAEIHALARRHLRLDSMQVVVVGDAEMVRPQLEELDIEIVDHPWETGDTAAP